jgi:hypothetical protein
MGRHPAPDAGDREAREGILIAYHGNQSEKDAILTLAEALDEMRDWWTRLGAAGVPGELPMTPIEVVFPGWLASIEESIRRTEEDAARLDAMRERLLKEAEAILEWTGGVADESIDHDEALRSIAGEAEETE